MHPSISSPVMDVQPRYNIRQAVRADRAEAPRVRALDESERFGFLRHVSRRAAIPRRDPWPIRSRSWPSPVVFVKDSYNKARAARRAANVRGRAGSRCTTSPACRSFNQDEEAQPDAEGSEFKQKVRAAHAILLCTPGEYNSACRA